MLRDKFFGMAATLLILAGCTMPMDGYYGGYNGYGGGYNEYGSPYAGGAPYGYSCPVPQYGYPSVPVMPYGYPGEIPYYGYPSGPVVSGPPIIYDNSAPVPNNAQESTASETPTPNRDRHGDQRESNARRNRYGANQSNLPTNPGATDPSVTPGHDPTNSRAAGRSFRQRPAGDPQINRGGTQFGQRPGPQGGRLGKHQGTTFGPQPQWANQQRGPGTPMAAPARSRPMTRPAPGPAMTGPRPGGNRVMGTPQAAPQAQGSGRGQRRHNPGF